MAPGDKVYFPGLNGIRALAALSVLVRHVEQIKGWFGVADGRPFWLSRCALHGNDAVTLFFVLSGFLITYLLLAEHRQAGTVDVAKFYVRRVLRIWPLYYLIVAVGFVLLPVVVACTGEAGGWHPVAPGLPWNLLLFLALLPNLALLLGHHVLGVTQLWSVGVEEQFYLVWPWLVRRWAGRLLPVLIGVILLKLPFMVALPYLTDAPGWSVAVRFAVYLRIEAMAVGGIGAWLVFHERRAVLRWVFHPLSEAAVLVLMAGNVALFHGDPEQPLACLAVAGLHLLFLLNVACNPRGRLRLENPLCRWLGQLSYGLYVYHVAVTWLVLLALSRTPWAAGGGWGYNLFLYLAVLLLTVGVAAASFHGFEARFLRRKRRFAVITSGEPPTAEPRPITARAA